MQKLTRLIATLALVGIAGAAGLVASASPAVATTGVDQTPGQGEHIEGTTATLHAEIKAELAGEMLPPNYEPPTPKPAPPAGCGVPTETVIPGTPGSPAIKGPHGKILKPAVPAVPPRTEVTPSTCDPGDPQWTQPGERYITHTAGTATWPAKDIIFGEGELGPYGARRPNPSNIPNADSGDYVGQCASDFRPVSFQGFAGYYAPQGVRWVLVRIFQADQNLNYHQIRSYIDWGGCDWPAVTTISNTCPMWVGSVKLLGPSGRGLPVQSGPGTLLPASKYESRSVLTRSGAPKAYSRFGAMMRDNSFYGLSTQGKANAIAGCLEDISAEFPAAIPYFGNWVLMGPGERQQCAVLQFVGMQKFLGCKIAEPYLFVFRSYKPCDGELYGGQLSNYDFSCPKPTGVCIKNGPCPVPDPTPKWDGPFDPATMVKCTYEPAVTTTPDGVKVPVRNGSAVLSADGRGYHVSWGAMVTEGSPAIVNQWTDFFVRKGSSPGIDDESAADESQPFSGSVKDGDDSVLMWSDDTKELGRGVPGPWRDGIDMHWYAAGNRDSTFVIFQRRSFTWSRNLTTTNWDGSTTTTTFQIQQACQSVPASFIVVGGRNSTGR